MYLINILNRILTGTIPGVSCMHCRRRRHETHPSRSSSCRAPLASWGSAAYRRSQRVWHVERLYVAVAVARFICARLAPQTGPPSNPRRSLFFWICFCMFLVRLDKAHCVQLRHPICHTPRAGHAAVQCYLLHPLLHWTQLAGRGSSVQPYGTLQ